MLLTSILHGVRHQARVPACYAQSTAEYIENRLLEHLKCTQIKVPAARVHDQEILSRLDHLELVITRIGRHQASKQL